ncbi:MAG TPA: 8-amino-7-oxononanoate synthase [Kofleriaceae bacterium]|nr:8-amino-7-oxononanoate synthase [Kofleriaceae bacterium]
MSDSLTFLDSELADLEATGLRRSLRRLSGPQGAHIIIDGREVVCFSSNDYLGLAGHPRLQEAARAALATTGTGAGASRLIAGNLELHEDLEAALARFHQRPASLLFNSGYHANVGTLAALAGPDDVIFSDALNHASIVDGCRLSRAAVRVYPHADVDALGVAMAEARSARRRLIVTDGVFSMDGDVAPLAELATLARAEGALLYVDEAHAVGVLGPGGRGAAAAAGCTADIHMGTLGKAMGSFGAYVAGSESLREYLLNRARTFVFTTALPPAVVAASREAVALCGDSDGAALRSTLLARIGQLTEALAELDLLAPGAGHSAVFPILVGDERQTMAVCARLLDAGLYAQGIRPPTVPRGTSRLRLALSAGHTADHILRLVTALADLADAELIPRQSRKSRSPAS